ncbi:hypothetical Protein YC6258_01616 [Gynuella sunshinyii YC6258]|uniref:Uncharacterized protein n=1 Tax=Gynuella sunshinyii YC6258 TaxID=1445510 RepID=A0A0C5VTL9_9GAMM|nr:hypothetical Protein YC6258_01616 [Gynuella sunshinyii YC6258]
MVFDTPIEILLTSENTDGYDADKSSVRKAAVNMPQIIEVLLLLETDYIQHKDRPFF